MSAFTDFWCGPDPWGPWENNSFTYCFDGLMVSALRTVMLPLLVARYVQAYWHAPADPRRRSIKFIVQLFCCVAMAVLCLAEVVGGIIEYSPAQPPSYVLITACLGIFDWTLSVFVMLEERRRFMPHNWILRTWWIAELFVTTLQLPTVVSSARDGSSGIEWDGITYSFSLILQTILCILLLFSQMASYYKPPLPNQAQVQQKSIYSLIKEEDEMSEEEMNEISEFVSEHPETAGAHISPFAAAAHPSGKQRHKTKDPDDVNYLSYITFSFISSILHLSGDYKRRVRMQLSDISNLAHSDTSKLLSTRFQNGWKEELKQNMPKVARVLRKLFRGQFLFAGLIRICYDILIFVPTLCLYWMIGFATPVNPKLPPSEYTYSDDQWEGFITAGVVLIGSLAASLLQHVYLYKTYRLGQNVRSCIVTAVYRKCFTLSNGALHKYPTGIIVNHMSVDPMALLEVCPNLHMVWSAPLEIILSLIFLLEVVSWSALVGFGIIVIAIPMNAVAVRRMQVNKGFMMKHKDTRGKVLNEVLQSIKTVKLMVWEAHLHGKLNAARHDEITSLLWVIIQRSVMQFITWCLPMLVSLGTFAVLSTTTDDMSILVCFTAIALFNVIRFPMMRLPKVLADLVQSMISLKRIGAFLCEQELDPANRVEILDPPTEDIPAVVCKDASFIWEDNHESALSNVNFVVPTGKLVAIIGQVASGKSALLQAIMGFLKRTSGEVTVRGRVSYSAQHAWVQNLTLRDNIMFGSEFDEEKYQAVVSACELRRDISIISGGDMAEIGEEGNNLSGGQKQRLGLARAVYQNADVFLLDDTLSAVDANVGESIFKNCIQTWLKGKTRIFVTQQFQYLSRVDYIYVVKDGTIVESGTYEELLSRSDSEFARLNMHYEAAMQHSDEAEAKKEEKKSNNDGVAELMIDEMQNKGNVPLSMYILYFREAGIAMMITTLIMFVISTIGNLGANFWLSSWTEAILEDNGEHTLGWWLGLYAAIILGTCFFLFIRFFTLAKANMDASEHMHSKTLKSVLQAPMTFFYTTPLGRLLNRFSEDLYTIDDKINFSLAMLLGTSLSVIGIIVLVCYSSPFFLSAVFPLVYLYLHTQEWYLVYARELVRLDAISRSPLYASFAETIHGLHTIRTMKQTARFIRETEKKLDLQQKAYYALGVANRWLGVRVEFVAAGAVFFAFLLCTAERSPPNPIEPNMTALSIIMCMQLNNLLTLMVQSTTEFEGQMVSVQRFSEYLDLPQEFPLKDEDAMTVPPPEWPTAGKVEFVGYTLQYRPELPPALINLSLVFNPGEKIGVVGRTGAGKSSLMVAIFRLSEASQGKILIDDVDIAHVNLKTLRGRLCVIPQDPVLFRGTLQENLDILGKHTPSELWEALDAVNLKAQVEAKQGQLQCEVTEGGENFSIGERQLICLARGLLSRAMVIVLDEATASVDLATEEKIHRVIFERCSSSTMILIAHRLHTILKCNRVMMMERGEVIGFGPPGVLMEENASFSALIKKAGFKEEAKSNFFGPSSETPGKGKDKAEPTHTVVQPAPTVEGTLI
ncbi:multidrug resistance-associated protein 3 [Pelomyxa schiedti]|nr:multidrug resistance-associated protein 3 [Pelomyxa schiedti]